MTSVLALFTAISYTHRVPAALFGLDQINIMLTLYLAIGPSGQTLVARSLAAPAQSWATRRPGRAPSASANLAQRLIQVHMCVIYLFAGLSKLQGTVVVERRGDVAGVRQPRVPVARHDLAGVAPVVGQCHDARFGYLGDLVLRLDLEAAVAAGRAGRGGRCLHVGIGLCLGMWTFGLIMLVGCASFLPNELIRDQASRLRRAALSLCSLPRVMDRFAARHGSGKWICSQNGKLSQREHGDEVERPDRRGWTTRGETSDREKWLL